jgi:DNA repair protein SbcC/Rad50
MRPTRLELEGFTSFRNKVILDFSPLELFGITGPTGAGKSSLIDGLVYALYGRTPRLGDKSVSDLVSQGTQQLRVFLEFTAGNKRYRIARALKRGKSAKVQLEIHDGTGGWDAIAATPGEVKEQIPRIVGLDYEGFTKAVVLPQGRFDEFLRGKIDERRRILADLLNLKIYEDMKQRANSKAAELRQRIDLSEKHLANDYGDATRENQEELENSIKDDELLETTLSKTWQQLAKALPVGLSLRQLHESQQSMHKELKSSQQQLHQAKEEAAISAGKITELQARLAELDRKLVANCSVSGRRKNWLTRPQRQSTATRKTSRQRLMKESG